MSEQSLEVPVTSTTDTIDAAVDTALVGVFAGGMDAGRDKALDPAARPLNCLNCGAKVQGRYCVDCGQATDTHVLTLMEMLGDYLTGFLNLDSRIWRTLGVLLLKPGKLTQEYLAGRRARYILPLRLYLAMSIVVFLVAALPEPGRDDPDAAASAELAGADAVPGSKVPVGPGFEISTDNDPDADAAADVFFTDEDGQRIALADATEEQCQIDLPGAADGGEIETRVRQACLDAVEDNFKMVWAAFVDNVPLMAFLIIPVMAAVFKLFYLFTGRGYLEHLAFLCHTHAFTLFLFAFLDLFRDLDNFLPWLSWPVGIVATLLAFIYQPAYYFVAMRRVYGQGALLTLVKLPALFIVYVFVTFWVFAMGGLVLLLTA